MPSGKTMLTILLVDDDPAVREVIEDHLADACFSVITAPGTSAALVRIGGPEKIDLLLVDLVMPADQPDGLAFATTAMGRAPALPVIFITGYYGFVARAGALPGTVLYKPVDLDAPTREINVRLGV
jgi:CheY-like chemotaxis protein